MKVHKYRYVLGGYIGDGCEVALRTTTIYYVIEKYSGHMLVFTISMKVKLSYREKANQ
jgi:hypothetical protein